MTKDLNFIITHKFPLLGKTTGTGMRIKTTTETSTRNENTEMNQRVMPNAAEEIRRHDTLAEENVYVGLMFGSKALVQLLTNPWIGPLTNKLVFRKYFLITFKN